MPEQTGHVRLGAELITFFNTEYWGLPKHMDWPDWVEAFKANGRANFDRMLDEVAKTGVAGVEIPPDPGGWTTARDAYGDAAGFKRALDERGLQVGSSYEGFGGIIGGILDDPSYAPRAEELITEHARFLADIGSDTIVMGTLRRATFAGGHDGEVPQADMERVAEQFNRLGKVIAPYGVRFAIHTDSYSICSRPDDIRRFMGLTDPSSVLLCPDAGHITLDGGDAADVLAEHVDRVPVMHWKDCVGHLHPAQLTGTIMEQHEVQLQWFRVIGDGIVDWKRWQATLRDADWTGWAMAELDMSPDPVGEIRQGIDYFERELAPIYR